VPPVTRRAAAPPSDEPAWLVVREASHNNLKNIDVHLPLRRFVCVTGVSGSGKSSLVNDIIYNRLARDLNGAETAQPGRHRAIEGIRHLDKVIAIDQSPIGRTPRSNPATYIKLFDEIRDLYAQLPDSKVRGYKPGRFSFNVKGGSDLAGAASAGRCEACEGNGANRIEMDFLADIWVTCPVCSGRRFNRETLQVLFKGRSIAEVLDMDVQQALEHFANVPKIAAMLQTLHDVGLDYLKLGQPSTTLSGGEAQRIKLAKELVRRATGRTLYILDEPTTGLHFEDIRRLLAVLHGFVDVGNSVFVIEHNLDVIKTADWVIDLGPEGGDAGGSIVAEGTPEQIARNPRSCTGAALRPLLEGRRTAPSTRRSRGRPRLLQADQPPADVLRVVKASEHNLKDVSVDIPRGAMTVCSGVSGSGKSSLAIDTLYVEGQRRYVESLSAYARQFLGQFAKPKVEHIHGLAPAIAIEQKSAVRSPRSTVGTITEIYDYMRVLWARVGQAHCPACAAPVGTLSTDEVVEAVMQLPAGTRVLLCAPIERSSAESYDALFARCKANGYVRVRVDGEVLSLDAPLSIDVRRRHAIEVIIDRIVIRPQDRRRIADSVEHALSVGNGVILIVPAAEANGDGQDERPLRPVQPIRLSQHFACDRCGRSLEEFTPHHFSFNSRLGWCPACEGLGVQRGTHPSSIATRPERSILDGAVANWSYARDKPMLRAVLTALAAHIGFDPHTPWKDLAHEHRQAILTGTGTAWIDVELPIDETPGEPASSAAPTRIRVQFKGFFPAIDEATRISWQHRLRLGELVSEVPCRVCEGSRLRDTSAAVRVDGRTLPDVCRLSIADAQKFFNALSRHLSPHQRTVAGELLHEINARLRFLIDVGLDYLSLDRAAPTLSGGETQRIQLASQIGSGLTGVLYVLDEPTIGLHPRDNRRLIEALLKLRDLGNTLLVVEHDREVIAAADRVLDFGPGAGADGGRIVAEAPPDRLAREPASLTGQYLGGAAAIPIPSDRRPPPADGGWLTVRGARQHNLAAIDARFPLARFVCVSGVSGSGKSTLVSDILYPALATRLHHAQLTVGAHERIEGVEKIDKVISVDQSAIGNSPLSNACTYTGAFDLIRELFARLPESRVRGFTANRFSFNRAGGRCEACEGLGQIRHEMHFLPDVWVTCETCGGKRYNRETLDVRYKGRTISDVLDMRAAEALELFANVPRLIPPLQTLVDVGLGYLPLGQAANTLSGGEAQRVRLAAELCKPSTGRTLYMLDEPTTGLHFEDVRKLLDVLQRLVDRGNTVLCIEHNLDVLKSADWIIDLGPEAGPGGGTIVAAGPPETIAAERQSHTGRALRGVLAAGPRAPRAMASDTRAAPADGGTVIARPAGRHLRGDIATKTDRDDGETKMPWQINGRGWHLRERVSRRGEKIEWEGAALEFIVEQIERLGRGALEPTDWTDRTRVEMKARPPSSAVAGQVPWLMHALTGSRWLLDVCFRVPKRTFSSSVLASQLALKTLDERDDLPVYGREPRVRIRPTAGDMDSVRLLIHDLREINTPAFRKFLRTAVRCYLQHVRSLARDVARAQPWKVDGRAWHLSQKSIPPTQPPQWQPMTLIDLIGRMSRARPDCTVDWGRKSAVCFVDRAGGRVARITTHVRSGLVVEVPVRSGTISPAELSGLGLGLGIDPRGERATIRFEIAVPDQADPRLLSKLLQVASPEASPSAD